MIKDGTTKAVQCKAANLWSTMTVSDMSTYKIYTLRLWCSQPFYAACYDFGIS